MRIKAKWNVGYFNNCCATNMQVLSESLCMHINIFLFFFFCSGTTILLASYRDRDDALNYIAAGGMWIHIM